MNQLNFSSFNPAQFFFKTTSKSLLILLFCAELPRLAQSAVAPLNAPIPPEKTPLTAIEDIKERTLSEVTRGFLGIDDELMKSRQHLMAQASKFLRYRKNTLGKKEKIAFLQECTLNPEATPFCPELGDLQFRGRPTEKKRTRNKKGIHPDAQKFAQWIRSGNLEKLKTLSEDDLRAGFKKIQNLSDLDEVVQNTTQNPTCSTQALSALLGFKMEEFLPDEGPRKKAIQLYEKAIRCETNSDDLVLRARFRLSLLKIWENNCISALPQLQFLTEHSTPTTDFAPRALFWQYQCGIQLKKQELSTQAKKALTQRYPFSLQAVITQLNEAIPSPSYASQLDSPIQARLPENHPLNIRIRAIEALLKMQQTKYAQELLNRIEGQIDRAPARFRLYVAALYFKMDESIRRFRLLNSVFKEDATLISKTSLELFYPQKAPMTSQAKLGALDGILVLSLIRQESAFNARAKSPAGALGLMQVMPQTARRFFRLRSPSQLYNPSFNLEVGSHYFSRLLKTYEGDAELALAAYNAGPKRVEQWLKRYPVKDRALFIDLIPFKETRDYVNSITRNYFWYTSLYSKRFNHSNEGRKTTMGKVFNLFKS